ncbi:molybdenum cofactor guanylyltransferase MobA [Tropicibacter naphthalenivorans]|uniref:Molybdenum cofactor guanylyltransferase n=1 Tax=Tropicibacter naphthalenivorans TaxID=441103 RepID=A0A0N7LYK2_9RHOB|nr:molybdenum cofactor guanylyltransferase MobA [Tropicibacter naphthalenivorans]CUH75097.1 Molybdenum cofactor guanylyltransferase [Tropicibacter naphthalenivorans]SMC46736.1 molybdenum cofactor guanylyltransferase [Tropicibacter naphthalenivorans]
MMPLGVILAGGQATRMGGGDKGLLPLGGARVIDHVLDRLRPQVGAMCLNANGDPARFDLGLPVVPDSIADYPGPLAGVLAGMDWAATQGAEAIVTVAADTPFFPRDLVATLVAASAGQTHPLVLAAQKGDAQTRSKSKSGLIRHPTFGLWPVALRDDLRAALDQGLRKVVLWTEKHGGREAIFPAAQDPFFNINTPEDLIRAEERA